MLFLDQTIEIVEDEVERLLQADKEATKTEYSSFLLFHSLPFFLFFNFTPIFLTEIYECDENVPDERVGTPPPDAPTPSASAYEGGSQFGGSEFGGGSQMGTPRPLDDDEGGEMDIEAMMAA